MRATCKTWKRELDLCTFVVEPAYADIPQVLKLFPNVNKLDLSSCSLTVQNEDLPLVARLQKLKILDLRGCAAVRSMLHL